MGHNPFDFGNAPGSHSSPGQGGGFPVPGSQPSANPFGGGADPFGGGDPFATLPAGPVSQPSAPPPPAQPSTASQPFNNQSDPFAGVGVARPADSGGVFSSAAATGSVPVPAAALSVTKPPFYLLLIAAGLALAAGVVALLLDNPIVAIVCWLVAGPIAIGVIAFYVIRDTFERSSGLYAAPSWIKPLYYGAIALCLVCILIPAFRIALWVGTL